MKTNPFLCSAFSFLLLTACASGDRNGPRRAELLFVGGGQSGESSKYASWLAIDLFRSGINLTYSEDPADIDGEKLRAYDGLVLFDLPGSLSADRRRALHGFLEAGKGLVVLGEDPASSDCPTWFARLIAGAQPVDGAKTRSDVSARHMIKEKAAYFMSHRVGERPTGKHRTSCGRSTRALGGPSAGP